jgi:hypothetical protein
MGEDDIFGDVAPSQCDFEEEPQRRHGRVHAGDAEAAGREAELVTADVFDARPVGRVPKERREVLDGPDVASLSFWPKLADGHILDHTPAQWADGPVGHWRLLSWVRL